MTSASIVRRKRVTKRLREIGCKFIEGVTSMNMNVVILRSRDPGICWKAGGVVGFATISEFSGPNSMTDDAPVLFRLRVNTYPPPAVAYHLRAPAVRHRLGLQGVPQLAQSPLLELTALPSELALLGSWLVSWLDSQFYRRDSVPAIPVPLIAWGWDAAGNDSRLNFSTIGPRWLDCEYLWTSQAITLFEPWLKRCA